MCANHVCLTMVHIGIICIHWDNKKYVWTLGTLPHESKVKNRVFLGPLFRKNPKEWHSYFLEHTYRSRLSSTIVECIWQLGPCTINLHKFCAWKMCSRQHVHTYTHIRRYHYIYPLTFPPLFFRILKRRGMQFLQKEIRYKNLTLIEHQQWFGSFFWLPKKNSCFHVGKLMEKGLGCSRQYVYPEELKFVFK